MTVTMPGSSAGGFANLYYEIPLLNFVGWFVLMVLSPLAWLLMARQRHWCLWRKAVMALVSLLPLALTAGGLSMLLNRLIAVFGVQ